MCVFRKRVLDVSREGGGAIVLTIREGACVHANKRAYQRAFVCVLLHACVFAFIRLIFSYDVNLLFGYL